MSRRRDRRRRNAAEVSQTHASPAAQDVRSTRTPASGGVVDAHNAEDRMPDATPPAPEFPTLTVAERAHGATAALRALRAALIDDEHQRAASIYRELVALLEDGPADFVAAFGYVLAVAADGVRATHGGTTPALEAVNTALATAMLTDNTEPTP